ncbi:MULTISPECIES: LysR family transcriptional regulator [unclassified Duganella]|uniref:LysR family transcriptional regulator n=1 Tax=unclassified Duganella TaxID=2636909 RepID=UPI0006F5005B|nr:MULTISPECIES: LysR family transcriptional regulator [unclassified Duganella]KQV61335.1 LysR family transcriptional regulator [Duganella sp. Root336D2]KRB92577.1 LysR family transcriptional regulator [Duganella sp. Root198D2]
MTTSIPWDLYRSFLHVLNAQSLSGAARSLGLTQPTVGRHISELESSLGLALFTRSQSGLQPTEAALQLRNQLEEMQHAAASIERSARGHNAVRGAVRISASEVVGVEILPLILAPLRAEYPELAIELVLNDAVQDLLGREVDIAVRMTQPQQDLLLAQRVGEVALGFYAHEDYLAARGTPKTLADLAAHSLIGFDMETPFLRSASAKLGGWKREGFAYRCDSNLAQMALVRAGAGIGGYQVGLAARDKKLVRVLAKEMNMTMTTWVTMHSDLRQSARCKTVFDALVSGLKEVWETPNGPKE